MLHLVIILLLAAVTGLRGVEIDPPEVPNPWNASEARALVDHLAEAYGKTYDLKTPLAQLQQAYRQAWNARQAELFVQGDTSVDPRWAAARTAYDRRVLVDRVRELGGTPTPDATPEQLTAQVAQLIDQQRAALKAEAEAKQKSEAEARERAAEMARQDAERKAAQAAQAVRSVPRDAEDGQIPEEELDGLAFGAVCFDVKRFFKPQITLESWRSKAVETKGSEPPTESTQWVTKMIAFRDAFVAAGGKCAYIQRSGHEYYWMSSPVSETQTRIVLVRLPSGDKYGGWGKYGVSKKSTTRDIGTLPGGLPGQEKYTPNAVGVQQFFHDVGIVVSGSPTVVYMQK